MRFCASCPWKNFLPYPRSYHKHSIEHMKNDFEYAKACAKEIWNATTRFLNLYLITYFSSLFLLPSAASSSLHLEWLPSKVCSFPRIIVVIDLAGDFLPILCQRGLDVHTWVATTMIPIKRFSKEELPWQAYLCKFFFVSGKEDKTPTLHSRREENLKPHGQENLEHLQPLLDQMQTLKCNIKSSPTHSLTRTLFDFQAPIFGYCLYLDNIQFCLSIVRVGCWVTFKIVTYGGVKLIFTVECNYLIRVCLGWVSFKHESYLHNKEVIVRSSNKGFSYCKAYIQHTSVKFPVTSQMILSPNQHWIVFLQLGIHFIPSS